MITVVDYGVGNIGAILNMLDLIGLSAISTDDPVKVKNADKLILPGVGAFDKAMVEITKRGLGPALNEAVLGRATPVLGVCLGMQLMARSSAEGLLPGLGWIAADVKRMQPPEGSDIKVPHIGWADINPAAGNRLFGSAVTNDEPDRFYFVHSYHVVCDDPADVAATFEYGSTLCCAFQHNHITGVQFHPEKSHRFGMRLLKEWATNHGSTVST